MARIHPIEKCVVCGRLLEPLTPDNYDDLHNLKEALEDFIDKPPKGENICFGMHTNIGLFDDNADIAWMICSNCCRHFAVIVLKYAIRFRKKILFQKFDEIKEKLQNA